jgi:hypothetical protein
MEYNEKQKLEDIVQTLEYHRDMRGIDGNFRVGVPMKIFTNLDEFLDKRFTKKSDCNYKWLGSNVEFFGVDKDFAPIEMGISISSETFDIDTIQHN